MPVPPVTPAATRHLKRAGSTTRFDHSDRDYNSHGEYKHMCARAHTQTYAYAHAYGYTHARKTHNKSEAPFRTYTHTNTTFIMSETRTVSSSYRRYIARYLFTWLAFAISSS